MVWHESETGISLIAVDYFSNLFRSSQPRQIERIAGCMEARVTQKENMLLTAPVTDEEIQEIVFQIPPTRAPRPDDFFGSFYQYHLEVVGKYVINMIKAFWHSGKLLRKLNHTNLVFILKVMCPKNLTQYRPIALCNVSYKVLAKVLTNRLKRVMPKVICDNQSAFVAGTQIRDNILVVHKILHSHMHQTKE